MIFRIHSSGPIDIKDWGSRQRILDENSINTISDTLIQGNPSKIATSIPDPFARMYLFETAFQMVKNDRRGKTLYHMLVSDCLDVIQLLYLVGESDDIEFKQWNKAGEITALKSRVEDNNGSEAGLHPHALLGEGYSIAMSSDRFKDFNDIYLIFYKKILLGGTSPLTLFFTSPNFQRQMKERNIQLPPSTTKDVFFDHIPASLYERAEDFQDFLFKFYLINKEELSVRCPHFSDYIVKSGENDNPSVYMDLKSTDYSSGNFTEEYCPVTLDIASGKTLKSGVFDIFMYRPENIQQMIFSNSGFVMQPTVDHYASYLDETGQPVEIPTPLALAPDMNPRIRYIYDIWDENTPVEYISYLALHQRDLPGATNVKYPFVTTQDFLEDQLVAMPYNINNEFFFSGFDGRFEYLLPIKKEYFNFFTIDDLKRNLSIINDAEQVIIKLKVPIKDGNIIEFTKEYNKNNKDDIYAPEDSTQGFGMGIFPFYQVVDERALNDYAIMFIENSEKHIDLKFYRFDQVISNNPLKYSKTDRILKNSQAGSLYYRINENPDNSFDLIEVNYGDYRGLILPLFKKVRVETHASNFNFAIDFGTSNTHIAYNTDKDLDIKPFDIGLKDIQMVLLNERSTASNVKNQGESFNFGTGELTEILLYKHTEFVPNLIGDQSDIKFPLRTSSCENKDFISKPMQLFGNINIGFSLDSEERTRDNTTFSTNLKWGMEIKPDGQAEQKRVTAFFEQVAWMIKNKILLNDGKMDPNICWFVPTSMKKPIQNSFGSIWKDAAETFFGQSPFNLIKQSESVVPYYYLRNIHGFYQANDAINIDIGGGTVDIILYINSRSLSYSTSFKFGANTIWGDGITRQTGAASQKDNGFYLLMKEKIAEGLTLDNKVRNYYDTISKYSLFDSADIISFLFKYDDEFKITNSFQVHSYLSSLLFLYLGAIIYHISDIIKAKGLEIPMYITFTGKGSEFINIILPDNEELTKFCGLMFEKATGKTKSQLFEVVLAADPKEITANGGISMLSAEEKLDPEEVIQSGIPVDESSSLESTKKDLYLKDLAGIKQDVIDNLNIFIDIITADKDMLHFFNQYNIKFQYGSDTLKEMVNLYAEHSYEQLRRETEAKGHPGDMVEESPFFWCLKDTFYRLSKEFYKMK